MPALHPSAAGPPRPRYARNSAGQVIPRRRPEHRSAVPKPRRIEGTPRYRPLTNRHRRRIESVAEHISKALRCKGQHLGPLTHTGLRVLKKLLWHFTNGLTGRCFPSLQTLAAATGCNKDTAEAAVKVAAAMGVLTIHPRWAIWGAANGGEVRIPTSNGYTFASDAALDALLADLEGVAARLRQRGRGSKSPVTQEEELDKNHKGLRGPAREAEVVLAWDEGPESEAKAVPQPTNWLEHARNLAALIDRRKAMTARQMAEAEKRAFGGRKPPDH